MRTRTQMLDEIRRQDAIYDDTMAGIEQAIEGKDRGNMGLADAVDTAPAKMLDLVVRAARASARAQAIRWVLNEEGK